MGLWQLAQAASALNTPIQSIYPEEADPLMRLDFNRIYFPVNCDETTSTEPLMIMWTGNKKGSVLMHFVPLLPKRNK